MLNDLGTSVARADPLGPGQPTPIATFLRRRFSSNLTKSNSFELSHDPIEPPAGEFTPAQRRTEVGPVKQLRARCSQRRHDAGYREHLLYVRLASAIYVAQDSRGLRVLLGPAPHADFQQAAVPESAAQQDIKALLARVILFEISDYRFRRCLSPMLDHLGMEGIELAEVPIEATARDAKLARKDIRLQSLEPFACQRF